MKIEDILKINPKAKKVSSATNRKYKKLCEGTLKEEIKSIIKHYNDSERNAWKYYVKLGCRGCRGCRGG